MSFTRLLRPHAVRAACAALALSLSGLALAEPIKVGYLPVTGHAKFFVAKEQGLFAQEGLDVELVDFQNSADGLNAVVAGKLDVGAFGTTAILWPGTPIMPSSVARRREQVSIRSVACS